MLMKVSFNFQINPDSSRVEWPKVPVYRKLCEDRVVAAQFARKLAKLYKAEVRLSEGADPMAVNGDYFRQDT